MHSTVWRGEEKRDRPQCGRNEKMTRSPGLTLSTPGPFSTTMPAASCPSTIGNGNGQSPFMMCQSLMQTPAALTRTRTSLDFGGSCSSSRIWNGLLISVRTAAPILSSFPPDYSHRSHLPLLQHAADDSSTDGRAERLGIFALRQWMRWI